MLQKRVRDVDVVEDVDGGLRSRVVGVDVIVQTGTSQSREKLLPWLLPCVVTSDTHGTDGSSDQKWTSLAEILQSDKQYAEMLRADSDAIDCESM